MKCSNPACQEIEGPCSYPECEGPDLPKAMRVFESGATRNVEVDPDYHGFLSPLALHAYGEYMHRHRLQADGTMRDSDNWQKGIPNDAFVRSLVRHVHDIQLIHDGFGEFARQDDRDDNPLIAHLCATLFNVQGLLYNVMKAGLEEERADATWQHDMFRVDELFQIVGYLTTTLMPDLPMPDVLEPLQRAIDAVRADRSNRGEEIGGLA